MFETLIAGNQFICSKTPLWNQGQGGNVSFKSGNTLFIKASGTRLDQIKNPADLVSLDITKLKQNIENLSQAERNKTKIEIEKDYPLALIASAHPGQNRSPSMETGFHAILPKPFVFHFHSLLAIIIAENLQTKKNTTPYIWLKNKFAELGILVAVIDFTLPGWNLIKETKTGVEADVLILKNHGIILQGQNDQILNIWWHIEKDFVSTFELKPIIEYYQNDFNFNSLNKKYLSGPFKFYFPDAAVFAKKIQERLTSLDSSPSETLFLYNSTTAPDDSNYFEIWVATQIIHELSSQPIGWVPEISLELCAEIQGLPAEQLRKAKEYK